jgi:hypothetical protein
LTSALRQINKIPNAWVRLGLVVPDGKNLGLLLNVSEGKRSRIGQRCRVRCIRVREWHLDDFDGGGIRLYGSDHPLARQYSTPRARLRLARIGDTGVAVATLLAVHTRIFDDWVPCERYLGSLGDLAARIENGLSISGPEFVLKAYARALRPLAAASLKRQAKQSGTGRFKILHFSQSFVVAERFEADLMKEAEFDL